MAEKSKLEEIGGRPESIGRASAKRLKDQEGIVKASDASFVSRLAKKTFGSPLSDLSNKELNKLVGLPVMVERARRAELSSKAYLDAILRDFSKLGGKYGHRVGKDARNRKAGIDAMVESARELVKKRSKNALRKAHGGKVHRGRQASGSSEKAR